MLLHEIIIKSYEILDAAQISFELSSEDVCLEELGQLYDFLDDHVGSKARDKCESSESSNGS